MCGCVMRKYVFTLCAPAVGHARVSSACTASWCLYVIIRCEILGFTHPNHLQIWFIQSALSSCIRKLKTVVIINDDRFLSKPQL